MNIELARLISLKLQLIRQGVGIYIADSGVSVAQVERTTSGIVLTKAAFEAFPPEIDDLSSDKQNKIVTEIVLKACQAAGVKPVNACSSPSSARVVTRYFQLPIIPPGERNEAIRFEGSRYVPFKLNETVSSYYAKEATNKHNLEVVFNAIPVNTLRAHVDAVEGARIKLWDTEPPFYALIRSLRDKIGKNQELTLVIHVSVSGDVCLCLLKNHVFYVCRDFFLSLKDHNYLEKFFFEINSSLDYFKRQTADQGDAKIFLGGDSDLIFWKDHIEEYFHHGVKVEIIEFPVASNLNPKSSSGFLIPIGLALKALGVPTYVHDISLLDAGTVADERAAGRKHTGIIILAILLAGVLFYFGYYIPKLNNLQKQIHLNEISVSSLSLQFPDISSQPTSVLEQRVSDIETKTRLIEAFQESRSFIGEKLNILSQTIPNSIWFADLAYQQFANQGQQLSIGKRELMLQGYVYGRDIPEEELRQINEYVDGLKNNNSFMTGFSAINLDGVERTNYAEHSFTKFRIVCTSELAPTPPAH